MQGAKPRVARKASVRTGLIMTHDDELVHAVKKKDRGALERLAERMGPGHLGEALHRSDPAVAEAALVALPFTRGGVFQIGAVTERLDASDAALSRRRRVRSARFSTPPSRGSSGTGRCLRTWWRGRAAGCAGSRRGRKRR